MTYRSNYLGFPFLVDEPATRMIFFQSAFTEEQRPESAATRLMDYVSSLYRPGVIREKRSDRPVWEFFASSAWYQLEAGAPGFIHEGRSRPVKFAFEMRRRLGVEFPDDGPSLLRFDHAFMTGAARRFGRKWGVSIYGQMSPDAVEAVFPLAYEQGASYFWFWPGSNHSGVPHPEILEIARDFREYVENNPRTGSPQSLAAAADVAIALPWGYLFEYRIVHPWEHAAAGRPAPDISGSIWWSDHMELKDENGEGATYGDVLAAAGDVAAQLITEDIPFDFIYLKDGEEPEGYKQVIRILESGENVTTVVAMVAGGGVPSEPQLKKNFPNPFNSSTVVEYSLANPGEVRIAVYDLAGQRVRILVEHRHGAGTHRVTWHGRDDRGNALATGLYLTRLEVEGLHRTVKMLLLQ